MRIASDPDRSWSTTEIAKEFGISRHHLTKAVGALAQAGFLQTRRGSGGGAMLARPASEIGLGDVIRALERGHVLVECFRFDAGGCSITSECRLKLFLNNAEQAFLATLDKCTLADCTLDPVRS